MTPTEKAVEAMAKSAYEHTNDEVTWAAVVQMAAAGETFAIGQADFCRSEMNAALTALIALHPGIASVIEGTGVVMPREPTAVYVDAGARFLRGSGLGMDCYTASRGCYRAMLAAAEKEKQG